MRAPLTSRMNQPPQPNLTHHPEIERLPAERPSWFWALALGLLTVAGSVWVVGDFSRPLSDGNDTDQYEYVSYFFTKNLSLWPWPHLNLHNNQSFYPYGLNQVFLDWGFERDYWYALCYRLFDGPGPYLQYYYVFSLVVAAVGTFILLRPRFGVAKALTAGLVVSIFHFYGLYKFPVHLNVCIVHWTTLCIVATYRLLFDVIHDKPVSTAFGLTWVWLHVLVLGQELGYVAGFALTFTTLTLPVLAVVLLNRARTNASGRQPGASHGLTIASMYTLLRASGRSGLKKDPRVWLVLGLLLLSLWLYLPLTLQIALTAWQFDFDALPVMRAWSHPARLLIPYLPGLDTFAVPAYQRWFGDRFESYGQGSPGLYLVILAGVGGWQARRRVALWLPVVLMLVLCLLYHPLHIPTLKVFPWFSFNRHGGRASLVYPVLFMLLALPVRPPTSRTGWRAVGLLVLLTVVEWAHGFRARTLVPLSLVSDRVLRYCAVVRAQPGEAVFDWPFCTVGADGVGDAEGLCPYYRQQNAVFTFRRFYDKKAVGQYFGRLHPDQIQPFLRDGWPRLLTPGRSFTEADWQFFDGFLHQNRFAGINLYPDLLTADQVRAFYQRYGPPVAETRLPAAGRVVFLSLTQPPKK